MLLLHLALAAFAGTETVKTVIPNLQPYVKAGVGLAFALGLSYWESPDNTVDILIAVAALGLAMGFHAVFRLLRTYGDLQRMRFLSKRA